RHASAGEVGSGRRCVRLFFFSSRRRHTRWPRDWSSDVCSSDLAMSSNVDLLHVLFGDVLALDNPTLLLIAANASVSLLVLALIRSEERRVGKECRCGWGAYR